MTETSVMSIHLFATIVSSFFPVTHLRSLQLLYNVRDAYKFRMNSQLHTLILSLAIFRIL